MSVNKFTIVFVDNLVSRIFKTVELLQQEFENTLVFTKEKELFEYLEDNRPDVDFMNLDLQPNDAVTLLKDIRGRNIVPYPFVIIYSDKQDDFVQELAFNSGADSFISFQYKPAIVSVFLRNLLRRQKRKEAAAVSREIVIDKEQYLIFKNGQSIQLPRKEFRLFELLYNNPERFFNKADIAIEIWNDKAIATKRTIDVHIYNIRQFFGKRVIQSQKGKGYRINKKLIA